MFISKNPSARRSAHASRGFNYDFHRPTSRLGSSCFNRASTIFGTVIRPSLHILAKKLDLLKNKPTTLTVTFKISGGSNLNCRRTIFGTCKRFFLFNHVLKLTLWVKGCLITSPSPANQDKSRQIGTNWDKLGQIGTNWDISRRNSQRI